LFSLIEDIWHEYYDENINQLYNEIAYKAVDIWTTKHRH